MDKSKKFKIIIGLFYLVVFSIFIAFLFSRFNLEEINSYKFIQSNTEYFLKFTKTNFFITSFIFFVFASFWVFMLGFGSPVALLGGFIFGKWFGTLIVIISLSVGSTILYIFGIFFLKDFLNKNFYNKFQKLESKFKKNEFIYLVIYRFIGGIPFQLQNLLPVLYNVKIRNYFFSTILGIAPQIFIFASFGSGLEKIIRQNEEFPPFYNLIFLPEIYIPILLFIIILLVALIMRNYFFKK